MQIYTRKKHISLSITNTSNDIMKKRINESARKYTWKKYNITVECMYGFMS
jgi:hypothetical protein